MITNYKPSDETDLRYKRDLRPIPGQTPESKFASVHISNVTLSHSIDDLRTSHAKKRNY